MFRITVDIMDLVALLLIGIPIVLYLLAKITTKIKSKLKRN